MDRWTSPSKSHIRTIDEKFEILLGVHRSCNRLLSYHTIVKIFKPQKELRPIAGCHLEDKALIEVSLLKALHLDNPKLVGGVEF